MKKKKRHERSKEREENKAEKKETNRKIEIK